MSGKEVVVKVPIKFHFNSALFYYILILIELFTINSLKMYPIDWTLKIIVAYTFCHRSDSFFIATLGMTSHSTFCKLGGLVLPVGFTWVDGCTHFIFWLGWTIHNTFCILGGLVLPTSYNWVDDCTHSHPSCPHFPKVLVVSEDLSVI